MFEPKYKARTWGFRFSWTDAVAIGGFTAAVGVLWRLDNPLWWMFAIAVGHFFLFCNVFRITRHRELVWAVLFIVNIGIWVWLDNLIWTRVLLCQLPITIGLLLADMRTPGYHGVLASRLNPRLNDYLEGRLL